MTDKSSLVGFLLLVLGLVFLLYGRSTELGNLLVSFFSWDSWVVWWQCVLYYRKGIAVVLGALFVIAGGLVYWFIWFWP